MEIIKTQFVSDKGEDQQTGGNADRQARQVADSIERILPQRTVCNRYIFSKHGVRFMGLFISYAVTHPARFSRN